MLELGQTVTYIRQQVNKETSDSEVVQGEGKVKAIALDHESRPIVQIKEGDSVFNVPLKAVNPDADMVKSYNGLCQEIERLTKEGNEKSKEVVAEYNAKIAAICDEALGKAVEL